MSRFDITLGMLSILGTVVIISFLAMGEPSRMPRDSRGFDVRKVESGAAMFDQYCSNCHGPNASGGICPPLDATSGLHGGDIGPGIAWRLEELGWDPQGSYEYVYSAIESGRTVSSRPDRYPGNRTANAPDSMAMPSWGQDYDGPLRPDQIDDLASYIVAFRDAVPDDATPRPTSTAAPTDAPTSEPPATTAVGTGSTEGAAPVVGTPGTATAETAGSASTPGAAGTGATAGAAAASTATEEATTPASVPATAVAPTTTPTP